MKKILKRGMSGLLAVLMAFTVLAGFGTTTAFAASETAESYMISFPRDGDAAQIYSEDAWGHSAKTYMNGWTTGSSNYTTLHCMDSFDGKVCYCIEPGLSRNVGDTYHGFGEDFWDNYPSQYNNTIEPDDIKLLLGRIMQYGYQGNLSTSWRSQNDSDADKLAHAFATQLLVWETVVGERDADFDHVSTGGYDEILSLVSPNHPLYSRIMDYYDSIESSVQSHAVCPSFMSRSSGGAKTIELAWDGSQYIAELTDTNRVLSQFTFLDEKTYSFSIKEDGKTVIVENEAGKGFVNQAQTGGIRIEKTSDDGVLKGFTFRVEGTDITGNAFSKDFVTDEKGQIHIDGLRIGDYVISEVSNKANEKYELPANVTVTVHEGKTVVAKLAKKMPSTARSLKSCFCLTDEIFAARSVPCGRMAFLFAAMKRATITQITRKRSIPPSTG